MNNSESKNDKVMYSVKFILMVFFMVSFSCTTTKSQVIEEKKPEDQIEEILDDVEVTFIPKNDISTENFKFSFYEDFESILEITQDSNNEMYIDNLLMKFQNRESFTENEKIGLMVGGTSLLGYQDPRLEIMYAEIDSLLRNIETENSNDKEKKINRVIELSDSCIVIFPLSIEGIVGNYYGYGNLNDLEKKQMYFEKGNIIFQSMLKTGVFNNKQKPYIGFSNACIYWYCMGFAQAGYEKVSEEIDSGGNIIHGYKSMLGEVDYYLIPKKNEN